MRVWIKPLEKDFVVLEEKPLKETARCPIHYILCDENSKKYILQIGKSSTQKFYIERAIKLQAQFADYYKNLKVNLPLYVWYEDNEIKVLFEYFSDAEFEKSEIPIQFLDEIYRNTNEILCTNEVVELILSDFLDAWPKEFHERIRSLSLFKKYRRNLCRNKTIKLCLEHGDFAINNIIRIKEGNLFVLDFEFTRLNQPVGYDKFTYERSCGLMKMNIEYFRINFYKYLLEEQINCIVDGVKYSIWLRVFLIFRLILNTQLSITKQKIKMLLKK